MKIGVISDTHAQSLPSPLLTALSQVDLIVHAGDIVDWDEFVALSRLKEIKGVSGNMDGAEICHHLPRRQVFTCCGLKIGLFHGEGPPETLLEKVQEQFKNETVDVVIFGHSHQPFNKMIGGVLYFNPGSPTDEVFAPYRSYGILEISETGIKGKIIKLEGK